MANTTDPDAPSVPLPAPTGPHPVGRLSTELVDADRPEIYSTEATDRRELVLWVWYPAEPAGPAEPATYLPAPWLPVAQYIGLDVDGLRTRTAGGCARGPVGAGDTPSCSSRRAGSRRCC